MTSQAADARGESEEERDDRNLMELLQEVRIAGLGVQVLFGFLLSIPFTMRFGRLDQAQRDLYITALILATVSTALLLSPVAYHRLVFRRRKKEMLVKAANILAILGLVAVGLSVTAAVALVLSYVVAGVATVLITVLVGVLFATLWFAFPLQRR